jgi:hypothetical protein
MTLCDCTTCFLSMSTQSSSLLGWNMLVEQPTLTSCSGPPSMNRTLVVCIALGRVAMAVRDGSDDVVHACNG